MMLDRPFGHRNMTLRKVIWFGMSSLIGAGIVAGGTWLLTEKLDVYYVLSTVISGAFAFGIKFVFNALWTFKE